MIRVNGEARPLRARVLGELLAELGVHDAPGVAVAVNGELVPRRRWGERPLAAGDEVEIVGAVQGG